MMPSENPIAIQRRTTLEQLAPLLSDELPALGVVDFNVLDHLIETLIEVYPESWITHQVSVAAMSLPGVLEHLEARNIGVITNTATDLEIAQQTGISAANLVHNPSVQSRKALTNILDAGLSCSVDSFAELSRVEQHLTDPEPYAGTLGITMTPQASTDDNATAISFRGVGLRDHPAQLIELFMEHDWLTQLHLSFDTTPHSLQQTAEQVAAVWKFAEDVEHAAGKQRIFGLHIGAGIPRTQEAEQPWMPFQNHRFVHHAMIPQLFDGKYQVHSDATGALTAPAGMILARVELTKDLDDRLLAVTHAPVTHDPATTRVIAYDENGLFKDDLQRYFYDVTGPQGIVSQSVMLPELQEGDVLAILDVGDIAFSHNISWNAPVYGIRSDGLLTESTVLQQIAPVETLAQAAGTYQPPKLLH